MPSGPKKRRAAAKKKEGLRVISEETRKIQDEPELIAEPTQKQEVKPDDLSGGEMSGDVKICPVEDVLSEKKIELIKQVTVKNKNVEELLKAVRKSEEALLLCLDELNAIDRPEAM